MMLASDEYVVELAIVYVYIHSKVDKTVWAAC